MINKQLARTKQLGNKLNYSVLCFSFRLGCRPLTKCILTEQIVIQYFFVTHFFVTHFFVCASSSSVCLFVSHLFVSHFFFSQRPAAYRQIIVSHFFSLNFGYVNLCNLSQGYINLKPGRKPPVRKRMTTSMEVDQ